MTTFNRFEDVPYSVWQTGGDVTILDPSSVPSPLFSGQAIGIMPQYTSSNNEGIDPAFPVAPLWFWQLIVAVTLGVMFCAVYRLTFYDTFVVLRSAPEGKVEDLPNGDKIYTSPDGSTYNWDAETGEMTKIGGSTFIDIATITQYVAVLVAIIVIGYVLLKLVGSKTFTDKLKSFGKTKPKPEAT